MREHQCCECDYMKSLEDNYGRIFYFCMFADSPCFLDETGISGWCELSETTDEWFTQEL